MDLLFCKGDEVPSLALHPCPPHSAKLLCLKSWRILFPSVTSVLFSPLLPPPLPWPPPPWPLSLSFSTVFLLLLLLSTYPM